MSYVLGGAVASAAYKKWERAAMAGVSLVADAAEELERNTINPGMLCNVDARTLTSSSDRLSTGNGMACSNWILVLVVVELCSTHIEINSSRYRSTVMMFLFCICRH